MLYNNRINLSEEIDVAKNNNRKECIVCNHWIFNHRIKFQSSVCNGCHDFAMLITVKDVDYRCIFYNISTSELTLMKLGFLRVVFPGEGGGGVQFDPSFIFKEELI